MSNTGLIVEERARDIGDFMVGRVLPFFSIALLYFIKSDWSISKNQGIVAILAYITFMLMAFAMGWS